MKKAMRNIILAAVAIVLFKLSSMRYDTHPKEGVLAYVLTTVTVLYAYNEMNRKAKVEEDEDEGNPEDWTLK